jgi:replicative DNA helicase
VSERDERRRSTTGRVAPHNVEAESSLLGALLLSADAVGVAAELGLSADEFYKPAHQHLYEAIRALAGAGEPVDAVTVADELRRAGLLEDLGGPSLLFDLQASTPAISNAGRYARIVQDTALLRRLIGVASEIAEIAYDEPDDVTKALDEAEHKVFQIADRRVVDSTRPLSELLQSTMSHLEETYERGNALTGVPTGFTDLDELLSGLQPSTLNIVGARPSMGKTAFALNIAAHVAQHAMQPVLFFSLEMGHLELTQRILAAEAQVDLKKVRTGDLSQADWSKIGRALHNLDCQLYLDDNAQVSVMEIRAKARRTRSRHGGLALVVIDYLQLMTGHTNAENRQLEVSEISRNLKILARELDVPILALSQLSRNLESRSDKRPMLADLRESGALEQDADVVMFIYRDEVYNEDSPERGAAEVLVAKHRNGPIGTRRLVYRNQFTRFDNAARVL